MMTGRSRDAGAAGSKGLHGSTSESLRLLFLVTRLVVGGAEAQVVSLATEWRRRGASVIVASILPPVAFVRELEAAGVIVLWLGADGWRSVGRAAYRYIVRLRSWRPHVVHSHLFHANMLARAAAPFNAGALVVNTVHSESERSRLRERCYGWSARFADRVTFVGQRVARRYVADRLVTAGQCVVVPNGIDATRLLPTVQGSGPGPDAGRAYGGARFSWVYVGRLEPIKGIDILLEAIAAVRAAEPQVRLKVVGDGSLAARLRSQSAALEVSDAVEFLGERNDVIEQMAAADALVLPSRSEALPMVLLEAALAGTPVLATDVGAVRDLVVPDVTGWLVPRADPRQLGGAMLRVMRMSPAARQKVAEEAKDHVLRAFSLAKVVEQWAVVYGLADANRSRASAAASTGL